MSRHMLSLMLVVVVGACQSAAETETSQPGTQATVTGETLEPATTLPPTTTTSAPAKYDESVLVIHGGTIHTMDPVRPRAGALVVRGERIIAVGDETAILDATGPNATVIDLAGATVVPGFIDSHTHRIGDGARFGYANPEAAIADALSQGWTSIDELYVDQARLDQLVALDEAGQLLLRVNAYLPLTDPVGGSLGDWYTAYSPGQELGPMLRVGGLKLFPDSNSGRTLHYTQDDLTGLVGSLHAAGWQLAIKAISIQSHQQVLEALATVIGDGGNEPRHRIEHALAMDADQVQRMAEMSVIASIQPHYPGALVGDADIEALTEELGEEAVGRWRDLADAGVPLAAGYAFPNGYDQEALSIPPPGSPLRLLYRAPTQTSGIDTPPPAWMMSHALTVEETLIALTVGAAHASGTDDVVGTITEGKYADLVVLNGDPLASSVESLAGLEVHMTMVGGEALYCAPGVERWCSSSEPSVEMTVTASASRDGHGPELAFDGSMDGESFWSSGDDSPQWLLIEFPESTPLSAVRFVVYQNPESETVHLLEAMVNGQWSLVETFKGFTATGDVLEWRPEEPTEFEALKMTTVSSASWPEWFEIELVQ
jgi:predicted amidohydrolase YtcJ